MREKEMVLSIIKYGSPFLRKKSRESDSPDEIKSLTDDMLDTLQSYGGIGLAAPQVSMLRSLFIIDTRPIVDRGVAPVEMVVLNPVILGYGDNNSYYTEGCLSIPGINEDLLRPEKIEVRYRDVNFDLHEEVLDGIVARIFQHEYDHLQGVLFVDKLNPLKRRMIQARLRRIR